MNDSIGKKIAKQRKKAKMTQEDLAKKLYITDGTISKWETDKSVPDYATLKNIANIFDVKINYFLEDNSLRSKTKMVLVSIIKFIIKNWRKIINIIVTLFLFIYFLITFNSYQMYELKIEEGNNITFDTGYYIKSKGKIVLNITNINIDIEEDDIINQTLKLYTFVNNEKTYFYESSNLDYIMIKQLSGYEEYFNKKITKLLPRNLYIEIESLHYDNTISNYSCKLTLQKIVDSKWFFKRSQINEYPKVNSINTLDGDFLLNKGFKHIEKTDIYHKKTSNYTLYFNLNDNQMFFNIKSDSQNREYVYYYTDDMLLYINKYTKIKGVDDVIEKFIYNNNDKKLNCNIGECREYQKHYDEVLKIFNDIIK